MALNAGEMRQLVRIEQRTSTQDSTGEPLNTWTLFAERRASVERATGRELWSSQEVLQGRVPTIFRLRYFDGVVPAMRLLCRGKVFNILSAVDPDGRRAELVVFAEERVEEQA